MAKTNTLYFVIDNATQMVANEVVAQHCTGKGSAANRVIKIGAKTINGTTISEVTIIGYKFGGGSFVKDPVNTTFTAGRQLKPFVLQPNLVEPRGAGCDFTKPADAEYRRKIRFKLDLERSDGSQDPDIEVEC